MSVSTLTGLGPRRMLLGLALAVGLAIAVVAVAGSSSASAASKDPKCTKITTLRSGQSPALAYAPPQIAAAEGFMKRNCLKLEEQPVGGAAILLAQVQAGRADLGLLNPAGIIQALQSGIKLRIVAPNTGTGDFAFCVSKDSPITSLKQFEGKSIATTLLGANTDIAVRVLLSRAGVDLNKVKFVQILQASITQSIINQNVDGGQCNEPFLTQNLDRYRIIENNPMAKVFGKDSPVTYAYVTEDYYNKNKATVAAYQRAYLQAAKLVARNPNTFRRGAHFFANLPNDVVAKMRLPAMPLTYGIPDLIRQVKQLVRFGAIKENVPESQLRALFVPLPTV